MLRNVIPLMLVASLAAAGAVAAKDSGVLSGVTTSRDSVIADGPHTGSNTSVGMVRSWNMDLRQLVLEDGTTIMIPPSLKLPELKAGEKVSVAWSYDGSDRQATSVLRVQ